VLHPIRMYFIAHAHTPLKIMDALLGVDSQDRRQRSQSWKHYRYYMGFLLIPRYTPHSSLFQKRHGRNNHHNSFHHDACRRDSVYCNNSVV
jgi:hypothetical protein